MSKSLKDVLGLTTEPVATVFTNDDFDGALSIGEGKRGCLMALFAAAAKGRTAVISGSTCGCPGGFFGLGYGGYEESFPGGEDCFKHFLSSGNKGFPKGEAVAGAMRGKAPDAFVDEFLHGERYIKTPELVADFIRSAAGNGSGGEKTVFMPLKDALEKGYEPVSVALACTPVQLSALVILCNYFRPGIENVAAPYAAGCQSLGVLTYREAQSENPRGIIGLFDMTARKTVIKSLGANIQTFSAPYALYRQMEDNIEGSFLEKEPWTEISAVS